MLWLLLYLLPLNRIKSFTRQCIKLVTDSHYSQVTANPDTLQNLYGTPRNGHHGHHHNDHGTDGSSNVGVGSGNAASGNGLTGVSGQFAGGSGFQARSGVAGSSGADSSNSQSDQSLFGSSTSQQGNQAFVDQSGRIGSSSSGVSNFGFAGQPQFANAASSRQSGGSGPVLFGSVSGDGGAAFAGGFADGDITITRENTIDFFETITNVVYNSIPVTLTEFIKTTLTRPTVQVR